MNITGGIYKGRKIKAPDEKIVRPTLSKAREAVFSCLFSILGTFENKVFLDMFAGSGIMGLEALSRGFFDVVTFEKNVKVANIVRENYSTLGLKPRIFVGDSLKLLVKNRQKYDVIFIDPPYFSGIYESSLKKIIETDSLNSEGIIILEHVENVDTSQLGLDIIKQKTYSNKSVTFCRLNSGKR